MESKRTRRKVIAAVLLLALVTILFIPLGLPYVKRLEDPEYQVYIEGWMAERGIWGVLIVFGLQLLQVVIAVIPGEPMELFAGALCGALGGLVLCLCGTIVASGGIFFLSRRFGKRFLSFLFKGEAIGRWKWLQNSERSDLVIFLIFFIPGTPKDMLTYVVGLTDIPLEKFLWLSTLARVPSVLSSTMIGASVIQGQGEIALVVFVITGILGIAGIAYKERLLAFCRARYEKHRHKTDS